MGVRLNVEPDRVELEATHQVALPAATVPGRWAMVRNGTQECAALVADAGTGAGAGIAMDKYLRIQLRAKVGDEVEVVPAVLPDAAAVSLVVPAELERAHFAGLIRDALVGKPLSAGQRVPLFVTALTGDQSLGEVRGTEPDGFVAVAHHTELRLSAGRVGDTGTTYDRIGGLTREIDKIREVVEHHCAHPRCSAGSASSRRAVCCCTARALSLVRS